MESYIKHYNGALNNVGNKEELFIDQTFRDAYMYLSTKIYLGENKNKTYLSALGVLVSGGVTTVGILTGSPFTIVAGAAGVILSGRSMRNCLKAMPKTAETHMKVIGATDEVWKDAIKKVYEGEEYFF